MSELGEMSTRPTDPVGRVLYQIAKWVAVCGGVILFAMAFLTTFSVLSRAAFSAPISGDFELVAIGTGVAVFTFLPWCQLTRGNVLVDFFMSATPVRMRVFSDIVGGLLYALIAAFLTWRMIFGGIDMYRYNEMTMTINFPRWTTFPIAVVLLGFLVIVTVYTVSRSIAEWRADRYFDD